MCLFALGVAGCSAEEIKKINCTMSLVTGFFKGQSSGGHDFFSFDVSRDEMDKIHRFRHEHHVAFSNTKEDAIYHSGFTRTPSWWQ